jgi:tRNA A-37 threonylcarbamoyl transferase component Bud32
LLEPGQIFASRYRVARRIAEGGMGAIFEAEHTATERRVALKLLFPHIMSVASARKKFELEAKISARVNSPNIVEVLDAGFDEATKSPFLVMELLEGQTLAHYVRDRGPLGIDQALPLLQQVAAGLDAAHGYKESNGTLKPIVHRDLKPENLFMAREHGAWVVKILDFGIAKVLGETGNISQEVRGTPLYMAFEQVTAGALSPQTDVWALGLITYFIFTASHYWRSASEPSANVQSLFAEILTLPLEAPTVRSRQQNVSVQLPPAFDAWLLECIQRDPTRRFASAGAAIDALAQAFGKSPRARPRVDSKPAGGLAFASTAAYEPPLATAAKPLGTAASLPGLATERGSAPAPAQNVAPSRGWVPAAAAAGVLLLGGVSWLAFGGGEPAPGASGASAAGAPEAASKAASAPAETNAPAASAPQPSIAPAPEARVAPVASSPSIAPAKDESNTEATAAGAAANAAPNGATETAPAAASDPAASSAASVTPQVRVAPHDEAVPGETPAEASAPDKPSLPTVDRAPTPATSAPAAPAVRATSAPAPSIRPAPPPARAPAPARAPSGTTKKPPRGSDAYKMR